MHDLFLLDDLGSTLTFNVLRLFGTLGGLAIGRAFAGTWRSPLLLPLTFVVMAAAVQFISYAVVGADLFSLSYYLVALLLVSLAGAYGYRSRRAEQMARHYPWLFSRSGPLGWTLKAPT